VVETGIYYLVMSPMFKHHMCFAYAPIFTLATPFALILHVSTVAKMPKMQGMENDI
jgi:hypothetical protein